MHDTAVATSHAPLFMTLPQQMSPGVPWETQLSWLEQAMGMSPAPAHADAFATHCQVAATL